MTCDILTKIAVEGPWNVQEVGTVDVDRRRSTLKTAYDFGANIALQQSTDKTIETLIENGPSPESGPAAIWWAIACGLLSRKNSSDQTEKGARNLLTLIVQQLTNNREPVVPWIYCGPLHVVKNLLTLAPLSKGHAKPHTEEYEYAKELCNFLQTAFKTFGIPLLRSASENGFLSQESAAAHSAVHTLQDLATILECIEQAIGAQELAVNLNRLVLHCFGTFSKCFASIGDRSSNRSDAVQTACCSVLHSFARIVGSASKYLDMIGMDARSATALTKIEEVFCSPSFVFFASTGAFDQDVITAMARMRSCLKKDDFRRMKGLPDPRQRFFAPLAANVVPILEAERLRATCTYIMKEHQSCESGRRKSAVFCSGTDVTTMPYEPRFILRVLRLGAEYAVYCHNSAVFDLGLVTSGGLLNVAISAIAAKDEELRLEAYAALDAFAKAVGPEYGNLRGSAAGLYRDRRQLAFMLKVLKDSIDEPLQQVLPMFACWFQNALRILLRPTHGAYTAVMRYLLRQPVMDVNDCEGVVHLLRSTDVGAEVKATRLLALEVIQGGMWSRHDHLVVRRRRIYESILTLAGSSLGADPVVRDKALRVLSILPKRFPYGQVSFQLCRMHAFGSCLVPQSTDPAENRIPHLMLRVDALTGVASSLPADHDQDEHAACLSSTLRTLVQAVEMAEHGNLIISDINRIVDCAIAVSRVARRLRTLHSFNFKFLEKKIDAACGPFVQKEECRNSLALVMTQHESVDVDFSVLERLWRYLDTTSMAVSGDNEKPLHCGRVMVEAYIATVVLRRNEKWNFGQIDRAVFETAKVLRSDQCSIWSIVAAVALLCQKLKPSKLVMKVAELIPCVVPERLGTDIEPEFEHVKKEFSARLLTELIQYGTSVRENAESLVLTPGNVDRNSTLVRAPDSPETSRTRKRHRRE